MSIGSNYGGLHDPCEVIEADLALVVGVRLLHDLVDLLRGHLPPLPVENLRQTLLCYIT